MIHVKDINKTKLAVRLMCCLIAVVLVFLDAPTIRAVSDFYSDSDIQYYDPTACDPSVQSQTDTAPTGGSGTDFDGHTLPAASGGTGNEDPVNSAGNLTTTGESMTFGKFAKMGAKYRDYYITMRWGYVKWAWDGTSSSVDNNEFNWYNSKPRKVLVTNPRTNKSIIAVAMEAGPAPWAGAKGSQSANGYSTPQSTTPANYTGRVSGFPPKAISALGAKQTENGKGDKLLYSWAPDQNAEPGPTGVSTSAADSDSGAVASCCPTGDQTPSNSLAGSNNEDKIWNWLISKGFTQEQAAGIMGNFQQENSFKTEDNSGGLGIAQWIGGRRDAAIAMAREKGKKPTDLDLQLDYLWSELQGSEKAALTAVKATDNPKDAATEWEDKFERAGTPMLAQRIAYAKSIYRKHKDSAPVATSSSDSSASQTCSCSESSSGSVDVVLDPGHSGVDKQGAEKDTTTGLLVGDSSNNGERQQVWDVSQKVKKTLEDDGYSVAVTKESENSYISLSDRAKFANDKNAKIAVSIHNTGGSFGSSSTAWVTPQKVGGYRTNDSGKKTKFDDADIAQKSLSYSKKFVSERKKNEPGVQLHDLDFNGRPGLSPGNLSIVQLLSKVPWVYNETGQSGFSGEKYADGIAAGIESSIEPGGGSGGGSGGCDSGSYGDLATTIKAFAWPSYHAASYIKMRPEWEKVVRSASSKDDYVGGIDHKGIDCGGFVTQAIVKS
ncbi:N-acetylmuramoyl-L-alanine amidase, partial [Candidatus Saccharibacteria bacterium]|nr:N-acetylmuramoyl-L-alanine amidase [Candidatus Saccharibacteria bacterium]